MKFDKINEKKMVDILDKILKKDILMTSLQISEYTDMPHRKVLEIIREEISRLPLGDKYRKDYKGDEIFKESTYINKQNKSQPMYILNKSGIYQILGRFNPSLRRLLIARIEYLESIPD